MATVREAAGLRLSRIMSGILWIYAIQRSGEGDGFADVVEAAEPGYYSLDAHAEAGVGDAAVLAQVEVPLEGG